MAVFILAVIIAILILLIISLQKEDFGNYRSGGRGLGSARVFPNRFDAYPYGPYPYPDPMFL